MNVKRIDNTLLEKAFQDVRASRKNHNPHASIWDLALHWSVKKHEILNKLHLGEYQFSPCRSYFKDGDWRSYWQATDAVVLKAISYLLQEKMNMKDCHHLKGHGGKKCPMMTDLFKQYLKRVEIKKGNYYTFDNSFAFLGIQLNQNPEIASKSTKKHHIKLALRYAQNASLKSIDDYLR